VTAPRQGPDLGFNEEWQCEMKVVSKSQADIDYVDKLGQEAQKIALYVRDNGLVFTHHEEENVLREFKTGRLSSIV
jgi:hypothetical protein